MTALLATLGVFIFFMVEVGAVLFSLRNVLSQKLSNVFDTKTVLVLAHIFILAIFTLEFMRFFFWSSLDFMLFYTLGVVFLVSWIATLLACLANLMFFRPSEATFKMRIAALFTKRFLPLGLLLVLFIAFVVGLDGYALAERPFSFVLLGDLTGVMSYVPLFTFDFKLLVLSLFIIFLAFPSIQFVFAIRGVTDWQTKRAIIALVGCWDAIALDGLLMYGYLPSVGVNALGPGQVIAGVILVIMGRSMRRTSLLAEMLEPMHVKVEGTPNVHPPVINGASKGVGAVSIYKGAMLLEADPSVNYERALKDFALEMMANGRLVFAYTSKGSPVYLLLKDVPELRFFILSETSYPKPTGDSHEVMVPLADYSILLSVMDETVTRNPEQPKAIIFDNLSSLILEVGMQDTYKFLRQVNEILSHGNIISIFLILSKAHDDRTMSLLKNLYSGHLTYDATGFHVTKQG